MDSSSLPKILIVGGGFGGLAVARALQGAEANVAVVDRVNHHVFQPLLYQVATASLSPASISAPIRSTLLGNADCSVVL
ncbi:MAG: FAD-dependent oxidoreductase, partial [Planctomycetota bacterium]